MDREETELQRKLKIARAAYEVAETSLSIKGLENELELERTKLQRQQDDLAALQEAQNKSLTAT